MTTVNTEIEVTTTIDGYWVTVDKDDVINSPNRKGDAEIEVGQEKYLAWFFVGNPGQKYTIKLTPPPGYIVYAIGRHPLKRAIAKNRFKSSDTLRFFIRKETEK